MRLAATVAAALALAATALAADPPSSTASAQRGSLKVIARVLLDTSGGELKATWYDKKQRCDVDRTLRVSYRIDLVIASGKTIRRTAPARTQAVQNCAEGGPNFGFDVTARKLGMASANGNWRAGIYSIGVTAVDVRSGLTVNANLYREVTR